MTTNELSSAVGHTVDYPLPNGLHVECKVLDARMSWGVPQLQIQPNAGTGTAWVRFDSVRVPVTVDVSFAITGSRVRMEVQR